MDCMWIVWLLSSMMHWSFVCNYFVGVFWRCERWRIRNSKGIINACKNFSIWTLFFLLLLASTGWWCPIAKQNVVIGYSAKTRLVSLWTLSLISQYGSICIVPAAQTSLQYATTAQLAGGSSQARHDNLALHRERRYVAIFWGNSICAD